MFDRAEAKTGGAIDVLDIRLDVGSGPDTMVACVGAIEANMGPYSDGGAQLNTRPSFVQA